MVWRYAYRTKYWRYSLQQRYSVKRAPISLSPVTVIRPRYYALEDVLDTYSDNSHYDHVRNRTDLSLSPRRIYGSISLTLYNEEDYWNDTHTTSLGIGYSTWHNVKAMAYWLFLLTNADNSRDEDDDTEQ